MTLQDTQVATDACDATASVGRLRLPAQGLTNAEVLRAFDILRRRLATAVSGAEGAFVGYDSLRLASVPEHVQGEVEFTAVLVARHRNRHRVAYRAVLHPWGRASTDGELLAQATGQTVAVTRPSASADFFRTRA